MDVSSQTYGEYSLAENVVAGSTYVFKVQAVTKGGISHYTETLSVVAGNAPNKILSPPTIAAQSSSSITVSWALLAADKDGGSPITGYRAYMNNGLGGSNYVTAE